MRLYPLNLSIVLISVVAKRDKESFDLEMTEPKVYLVVLLSLGECEGFKGD